jgi:hypothetical protein
MAVNLSDPPSEIAPFRHQTERLEPGPSHSDVSLRNL